MTSYISRRFQQDDIIEQFPFVCVEPLQPSSFFVLHNKKGGSFYKVRIQQSLSEKDGIHQALNALFIIHEVINFSRKIIKCLKEQVEPLSCILFDCTQLLGLYLVFDYFGAWFLGPTFIELPGNTILVS